MAKANSADRRFAGRKFRFDAHWDFALQLDADNPDAFWDLLDERASWFYEAVGAGPSMAPKRPGLLQRSDRPRQELVCIFPVLPTNRGVLRSLMAAARFRIALVVISTQQRRVCLPGDPLWVVRRRMTASDAVTPNACDR